MIQITPERQQPGGQFFRLAKTPAVAFILHIEHVELGCKVRSSNKISHSFHGEDPPKSESDHLSIYRDVMIKLVHV